MEVRIWQNYYFSAQETSQYFSPYNKKVCDEKVNMKVLFLINYHYQSTWHQWSDLESFLSPQNGCLFMMDNSSSSINSLTGKWHSRYGKEFDFFQ